MTFIVEYGHRNRTAMQYAPPRVFLLSFILVLAAVGIRAQTTSAICEPTSAVKQALESLPDDDAKLTFRARRAKKLEALHLILQSFPDDVFAHRRFQDVALTGTHLDRQALIEKYRALAAAHAGDPVYLYLNARPLVGRKTPEAQTLIEKLLSKDPNFAWAHLLLAEIYNLPRYRNKPKAHEQVKTFFGACPAPVISEAYGYLRNIDDTSLLREVARALRTRLETSSNPQEIAFYETLWQLEFRAPTTEHPKVRLQVEADLMRLRHMNRLDNRKWLETLRAGHRLVNNKAEKRWAEDEVISRFPNSTSARTFTLQRWQEDNPAPEWGGSPEKFEAYNAKLLPMTEEWSRRWPNDTSIRYRRFSAVTGVKQSPLVDVEAAFNALQNAMENDPGDFFSIPPAPIRMAEIYLKRGVKLGRIPDLVDRGLKEMEAQAEDQKDSDAAAPGDVNYAEENLKSTYWLAWPVLVETYLKSNQVARTREVLTRMEMQLAKEKPNPKADASQSPSYQWREATYWEWAGRVAQAEGRRLDALVFYQNALTTRALLSGKKDDADILTIRAKRLWRALGGTDEGWEKWSGRGATKGVTVAVGGAWTEKNKPLSDFLLTDLRGRSWRLTDLKGKVTFINVWATWCGPCQQELPYVQKLYDQLKNRPDVLVMSFNTDQDVGLVEPYMKEKKFTFPVLPAYTYVGPMAIPRSWVVGPDGALLMEQVGFGPGGEDWLRKTLDVIERVSAKK